MVRNMGVARDLGYLNVRGGLVVDARDLDSLPDDKVVLVCTGSQGEPLSALARMANRDHQIRIGEGDTVLLASSLIPGNENAVYRVINGLSRWGADVVPQGQRAGPRVRPRLGRRAPLLLQHRQAAQRHAGARRVAAPARQRRPRRGHRRAARPGRPRGDGVVVDLVDGVASITGKVPCGYVYVDGSTVGDVTESALKDRRILRDEGFVSIVVVVDSVTGKVAGRPEIHARGFAADPSVFDPVVPLVEEALERAGQEGIGDVHQLQQLVRRTVGRWVSDTHRRRPMIIPVVVEV
jgi:ribonuclease J